MFHLITRPWFFVLLGVLMTVLSAVVTNYFIVENNHIIEKTQLKLSRLEKKIDHTWQNSNALEALEEVGTVLLLLSEQNKTNNTNLAVERYLNKVIKTGALDPATAKNIRTLLESGNNTTEVLTALFNIIDNHKATAINGINDLYIERVALERQKMSMDERNAVLRNIALFLQIMGLILVLSNNLFSRNPTEFGNL